MVSRPKLRGSLLTPPGTVFLEAWCSLNSLPRGKEVQGAQAATAAPSAGDFPYLTQKHPETAVLVPSEPPAQGTICLSMTAGEREGPGSAASKTEPDSCEVP